MSDPQELDVLVEEVHAKRLSVQACTGWELPATASPEGRNGHRPGSPGTANGHVSEATGL
jgi:hypothetical protein